MKRSDATSPDIQHSTETVLVLASRNRQKLLMDELLAAQPCAECGVDRFHHQSQVRQLLEKLEYSQLQNSLLTSQCNRLRQKLREAEFRGRSSVAKCTPPSLPNEVLRHVFFLATRLDGLVSPRWDNQAEAMWEVSSLARQVIPLVCRKWYMIGLELLYEHIILRTTSQISQLLETLIRLDPLIQKQRLGWIRGLEFVMWEEGMEAADTFEELACQLVCMLPEGKLRRFAVECGECHGSRTKEIGSLVVKTLEKSCGGLEALHLSCIGHADEVGSTKNHLHHVLSTSNLLLHTLSLTGGNWNSCTATGRTILTALEEATSGSIRTLLINCSRKPVLFGQQFHHFLASAVHLNTVHIVANRETNLLAQGLDGFLKKVPHLRHLLITPSSRLKQWPFGIPDRMTDVYVHQNLEDITLYMNTPSSCLSIFMLQPLMLKVKSGSLPHLQRIILHGDFPEGCLDGYQIFPHNVFKPWENAIDWCSGQGVKMVDHLGYPIYLWRLRHGIKVESSSGGSISSSDEDKWFEINETGEIPALEEGVSSESEVGSEGEIISDDPEDGPYRCIRQRDVEEIDPDPDDEER